MNDIEFKIGRYELIPKDQPTSLAVGFCLIDITTNNMQLVEHVFEMKDVVNKTQHDICQEAYQILKPSISGAVETLKQRRENIVGYTFIPND